MIPAFLWSLMAHHPGPADPRLLEWIKHRLDQIFGFGPWTVVVIFGLVLVAIPLVLVAFYLTQRRHLSQGLDDSPVDRGG